MSSENSNAGGGISFLGVLAIVFIVLKLTGHITWSWWWVTAPLWGGVVLVVALLIPYGIYCVLKQTVNNPNRNGF